MANESKTVDSSLSNEEDNLNHMMKEAEDERSQTLQTSLSEGHLPLGTNTPSISTVMNSMTISSNVNVSHGPPATQTNSQATQPSSQTSMEVEVIEPNNIPPVPSTSAGPSGHQARSTRLDEVDIFSKNSVSKDLVLSQKLEDLKELLSQSALNPSLNLHVSQSDSSLLCSPSNSPANRRVTRAFLKRKKSFDLPPKSSKKSKIAMVPGSKISKKRSSKVLDTGESSKHSKPAKKPAYLDKLHELFLAGSPGISQILDLVSGSMGIVYTSPGTDARIKKQSDVNNHPPESARTNPTRSGNRSVGISSTLRPTNLRASDQSKFKEAGLTPGKQSHVATGVPLKMAETGTVNENLNLQITGPNSDSNLARKLDFSPINSSPRNLSPSLSPDRHLRHALDLDDQDDPLKISQLLTQNPNLNNDDEEEDIFYEPPDPFDTSATDSQSDLFNVGALSLQVPDTLGIADSPNRTQSQSLLKRDLPPILRRVSPIVTRSKTNSKPPSLSSVLSPSPPPPPKQSSGTGGSSSNNAKEDIIDKLLKLTKLMHFKGDQPKKPSFQKTSDAAKIKSSSTSLHITSGVNGAGTTPEMDIIPNNLGDFYQLMDQNPFLQRQPNPPVSASLNTHVTNPTNHTNRSKGPFLSSSSTQDRIQVNIYPPALSLWRDLRNNLSREVTLQLRLNHYEAMLAEELYPSWSVNYHPPSSLYSNNQQVDTVVEARKNIAKLKIDTTIQLTRRELEDAHQRTSSLKASLTALYSTDDAKDYNLENSMQGAIQMANRTRMQQFAELCKRLDAIRLAPEEALWDGIPEDFPRPARAVRAPAPAPSPAPAQWGNQAGGQRRNRSQSRQRDRSTPRPQNPTKRRYRGESNMESDLRQELESIRRRMREMEEGQGRSRNQQRGGKGKGQGKKSNRRFRRF